MKKKVFMMGAGLTLGSALVVSSAFADIGGAKGYEAFKSAIKTTAAVSNATQHVALSVRDNGNELLNVNTTVKENKATKVVSGNASITVGPTSQTIAFYDQEGKKIFKAGNIDTYNVITESDGPQEQDGKDEGWDNPALNKEMENVLDALVGNLKNYVNLSDASGGQKTVDVKLTGSQIPAAANVIGSLLVKEALSGKHSQKEMNHQEFDKTGLGLDVKQIAAHFPKLSQDINIDEVALHATIDGNNYITRQEIDFTISGKDVSGQAHNVVISTDIEVSNINATTPDTIDLAGKKVNTIQARHFDH